MIFKACGLINYHRLVVKTESFINKGFILLAMADIGLREIATQEKFWETIIIPTELTLEEAIALLSNSDFYSGNYNYLNNDVTGCVAEAEIVIEQNKGLFEKAIKKGLKPVSEIELIYPESYRKPAHAKRYQQILLNIFGDLIKSEKGFAVYSARPALGLLHLRLRPEELALDDELAKYIFLDRTKTEKDLEKLKNEKNLYGLNDHLCTPQERALSVSTEEFDKNYYIPDGITEDGKSIDFINKARQIVEYFYGAHFNCIDQEGKKIEAEELFILFELVPLDPETGETLYDPKPKDKNLRVKPNIQERLHYRNLASNNP